MNILRKKKWLLLTCMLILLLSAGILSAAGGETLPRTVLSSGGGTVTVATYELQSVVGQPAVGAVAATDETVLCSGFLCAADAPPVTIGTTSYLYLPTLQR